MSNKWSKILLFGLIAAILQLLFVNRINFLGVFNPKIYPIFLLLLPKNIKSVYLMLIGFIYGFLLDIFGQTYGIGMASSVMLCFIKPYLFRILYSKREDDELEIRIGIQGLGFILRYLAIGLLIFHIVYFFIELGEFRNIFYILWKSILSTGLGVLLYALFILMFTTNSNRK